MRASTGIPKSWRVVLPLILGLMLVLPTGASQLPPVQTVGTSQARWPKPHTDGTYVVWYDSTAPERPGGLYAADLRVQPLQPFLVTRLSPEFDSPEYNVFDWHIHKGMLVWDDYQNGSWNIYGKQLPDGPVVTIADSATNEMDPAIDGNLVAWLSAGDANNNLPTTISGRSLNDPKGKLLFSVPGKASQIMVRGSRVVWYELRGIVGNWYLHTLDIGGEVKTIAEGGGWLKGVDFEGNTLVYVTSQENGNLYAYDFVSGKTTLLAQANAVGPTTDGRFVIWAAEDRDTKDKLLGAQLYGYDLLSRSRFAVATDTGINYMPHFRNKRLVWQHGTGTSIEVRTALVHAVLPSGPRTAPATPNPYVTYFAETGHTLAGTFKNFWQRSGGLPVFGYTLTEEFSELNRDTGKEHTVQYLERQRYEHHSEYSNTPYEVLLGRLGIEALQRQGRDWQSFPKADPNTPHYYAATGHAIAPQFWDYWRGYGLELGDPDVSEREALALFGYPISPAQVETNSSGHAVLTQWFERARFEYHPANPKSHQVLLGRLGADMLADRGW
jgi:hypothetical protein